MKVLSYFFLTFALSSFLVGCSGDVSIVKNSYLDDYKTTTVGLALDNFSFFTTKSWESHKTENGSKVVIFTGELEPDFYLRSCELLDTDYAKKELMKACREHLNLKKITHTITFLVNHDDTIEIESIEITYVFPDGKSTTIKNSDMSLYYDNKSLLELLPPASQSDNTFREIYVLIMTMAKVHSLAK